jgi:hypothetical protein
MSAFEGLGVQDVAPSALDFQMPTKTSFVQGRTSVRFTPTSGSSYSNDNRIITFRLASEQYFDPTTAMLNFTVKTPASTAIPEDMCALRCWDSIRVTVGGSQVELQNQAGAALYPILLNSASKDWIQSTAAVQMGSYMHNPSPGLSLNTDGSGLIITQLNSGTQIRGLSDPASSLGFEATNPQSFVGTTYRANSFPAGFEQPLAANTTSKFTGRKVNGLQFQGRAYSIPLSYLLGFFRTEGGRYIPARNCGAIEITLTLAPYASWFIQTAQLTLSAANVIDPSTAVIAPYNSYTVTGCSITIDALQIAPEVVNRIDAACASDSGVNMVVDTFVTTLFSSRPPSTMESFVCTRPYSNLLATYICGRPTAGVNSAFWRGSDYYFGSRFAGLQSTVGSLTFPVSEIQDTAQAWSELRKSLVRNNVGLDRGCCVSYEEYNSLYPGSYGTYSAAARGTAPDLTKITATGATDATRAAYANTTANLAPSCFLLGQSFARVLGSSQEITLTGLNSKLAGFSMTSNLRQTAVYESPNNTDPVAGPPCTLDSALGSANIDWLVTQVCSVLIRLANDSVAVAD